MKQFGKILKFEFKYYLKNKTFVGITLFLVIIIAATMFFPRISAAFKSDNTPTDNTQKSIMLVKAADSSVSELVEQIFSSAFTNYNVQLTNESADKIKEMITSEIAECAFIITANDSYTYLVNNLSMYDMNTETANTLLVKINQMNAMINGGMTADQASEIMNISIKSNTESLGKNQIENFFYTYIMIFALYTVILLYGQMVATNVATEKSSRAMELLITSANPSSMMFGKVIASCLAGLSQLVAIFGSALIFYNLNKSYWGENMIVDSIFNIPPELLAYMLIFFVLGFLVFAFMFGAVGSTASKLEDINTSVMPITMLFVVGFVIVISSMSSGNIDTALMKICSYIPFTSPMAMFTRIAMSSVEWYEIATSVSILIASTVGIGIVSAKIYRIGVLLYGTPPKITSVIKAVFKK